MDGPGEGVDLHISGYPGVTRGGKTGVNVLETVPPSLPDKNGAAVVEQGDTRPLLVTLGDLVDTERGLNQGKAGIQSRSSNAQAVAIGSVIMPDKVAAVGIDADLRKVLITRQVAGDRVLAAAGIVEALGGGAAGKKDAEESNSEARMSKRERSPKSETRIKARPHSEVGLRISFGFRHSGFGIQDWHSVRQF